MSRAGLAAFAARRLAAAIVLVVVATTGSLLLVHLAPGDATTELALSHVDAATVAATRARLGLDRPFTEQLGRWIGGLAHFDLGESSAFGRPVAGLLGERAMNTAVLAGVALVLALAIGVPLGLLAGAKPRSLPATCVSAVSIALVSCPPLVGALALLMLAVRTGWLSIAPGALWLPAIALALPLAATIERVQSRATAEVLTAPNAAAAAARGLSPRRILWVHVARQSVQPLLGIFGVLIAGLFSASLAVEWVTSWPGLGRLMYDALVGRDLHLTAGCALVGALLIAAGNLAADLLRGVADPRVRDV